MDNRVINQERIRATFALNCVEDFIDNHNKEEQKKYRAYIRNIPTIILNNGLGATTAFIFSKNSEEVYNQLGQNIYDWLKKESNGYLIKLEDKVEAKDKLKELTNKIIDLNSSEYRAVTNEVLSIFGWLKRFAEGMIEGDSNGKEEN